jgi:hypothetical protein
MTPHKTRACVTENHERRQGELSPQFIEGKWVGSIGRVGFVLQQARLSRQR